MKQIKDKVKCERAIEKLELEKEFDTQNLEFQIYQQEKGELLCQPCNSDDRLQIVIEGTVNIYHIRDDGSKYFIAMNEGIYLSGTMYLFCRSSYPGNCSGIISEKISQCTKTGC